MGEIAGSCKEERKIKKNTIFLVVLTALVMPVSFFAGCRSDKETLSVYNWSYYIPDPVISKFEREHNVRVIYDEFASNEEMYAKLKSGGSGYDVVFPSGDFVGIMIEQGMLERIDKTKIPNIRNIDPAVLDIAVYDPFMDYSVPYFWGAAGIAVNTAKVPEFEKDWSIFGRGDLKGRMTMLDDLREVIGNALAHLGYSINSTNPVEIEEARDYVNNVWKPNLTKFDSESFGKGYANGDFWVVHAFAEVVYEEILDNEQLMEDTVFFIPYQSGPAYIDNMVILRDARNIDMAHKFINFIHRPDIYAEFCDEYGLPSTVNVPARQFKEGEAWYGIEDLVGREIAVDLGANMEYYTNAWFTSIRAGN